jgi:glucosamine-6-phosphate deaminase
VRIVVSEPAAFGPAALREMLGALVCVRVDPVIGLATGNTPLPLYAALGEAAARGLPLGHLRPFAIDEYLTAPTHPCANRAYFRQRWQSLAGAPPVEQFHPAPADPAAEAARFAAHLAAAGGLDIAILGIGLNGHLAFNEPGSPEEAPARAVDLAQETRAAATCWPEDERPRRGLTLGLRELLAARQVILLASGEAKAPVVARALTGPASADCPASYLQRHPALTAVLDGPAAAGLQQR